MTIRAMNWAWEIDLPPALKLVLLKLADRANDDGECWPGQASISHACGVSKASVIRYLAKLEALGLLTIEKHKDVAGKQMKNSYLLNLDYKPGVNLQPGEDFDVGCETEKPGIKLQPGEIEPGCKTPPHRVATVQPDKEINLFIETTRNHSAHASAREPERDRGKQTSMIADPVQWLDDEHRFVVDDAVMDAWVLAFQNGRGFVQTEEWIEAEIVKAELWVLANPKKRKHRWLRFLNGWIERAADSSRWNRPGNTSHGGRAA